MTEYVKMALEARKLVTKLTLQQQEEILDMYEDIIESLANKAGKVNDESLTKRWLMDYMKEIASEKVALQKKLGKNLEDSIKKAAQYGVQTEMQLLSKIQEVAGLDLDLHFRDMFSMVPKSIVDTIISGELYKDGRSLSERIWILGSDLDRDVQYIVNRGLTEKKSAIELARDLEKYIQEPARRPSDWGKAYPNLRSKQVDYNAQRLARTSINHAYQTSTIQSSAMNPFVEGIEWRSSLIHGRTCDLCMERHGQIYPVESVPLDHPNGLCTMIPHMPKSLDGIADELRDWVYGGENPMLDEWYGNYGDYFAEGITNASKKGIIKQRNMDAKLKEFLRHTQKIKSIDPSKRKELASQLLEELDLQNIPVSVRQIKEHGHCLFESGALNKGEAKITEYVLNSKDLRSNNYKIKTTFHEAYHAKANGMKTDFALNREDWLQIEETFAETSAHFAYKQLGLTEEISPAYAEKLVEMLPRLKQLDKFKSCETFEDFGEIAWTDRLSGVEPKWLELYYDAMKTQHDWKEYLGQYIEYIDDNKDELLDVMLNNMPQYRQYKSEMDTDFENAKYKIKNGKILNSNENMVIKNLMATAMGRLGVK